MTNENIAVFFLVMDLFGDADDFDGNDFASEDEVEAEQSDDEDFSLHPRWLQAFAVVEGPPGAVATAWLEALDENERTSAKQDPHAARTKFRLSILAADCKAVRADKASGFKRTGAVLRALDEALGLALPKRMELDARDVAREIVPGDGTPGTLGVWWSSFEVAEQGSKLVQRGITHRLNCAAELVDRFTECEQLQMVHVAMDDYFDALDEEVNLQARDAWTKQFPELLQELRRMQAEGAVVNINCKMGKNRSGVAVMLWLCCEKGWAVDAAIEHLRNINAMALGNPVLLQACVEFLGFKGEVPLLCGDGDGGGWISISPPGSPQG